MTAPDHNRLISAAAKSVLAPLGCKQKGRSRTWLDDHDWWVGIVEFQPSAWSRGSYLNVGACWLWYEKDHFSFDDGSRVESFQEFKSVEQFTLSARLLAEQARDEVLKLRNRFSSLHDTSKHLCKKTTNDIWCNFHAGVCATLIGDVPTAKKRLAAVAREKTDFPWVKELKKRSGELFLLVDDVTEFRSAIESTIRRTRNLLKLSTSEKAVQFRSLAEP